jgi:hypothetical protein
MFFSMFSKTNVEILVDDGIIAITKVYTFFSIFVMFWVDPNRNICRRVQKNHLSLCTCFYILACWTCFGSFVGHVAPMYILLHYNYPETEKNKKRTIKI